MIIATIINDQQYQRVSFLESADFDNYADYRFREYYQVVKENNGDAIKLYEHFFLKLSLEWLSNEVFYPLAHFNLENLAIYLVEQRFKKVFSRLLNDLVAVSSSDIEIRMIEEFQLEINREDIFILGDSFLEYLGHHASDHTKNRMEAYLKWRDNRAMEIKKHLK